MTGRSQDLSEGAVKAAARQRLFFVLRKAWKRRQSEGLTATELAERVGRDKSQVSRVLNGSSATITVETLALFLDRLGHELVIDCRAAEDIGLANVHAAPPDDVPARALSPRKRASR